MARCFKAVWGIALVCVCVLGTGSIVAGVDAGVQTTGLLVQITQVDSTAFPLVEAYVSVLDRNGLPVYGLTEAHWTVIENGRAEKPSFTVRPDISQGLELVLALDTSVEADALPQIKQAARDLIRSSSNDRLAVVGFADEAIVLKTLTTPQDALTAVDTLTVTGQSTSLNEAVVRAIDLLEASRGARQAIMVLTDSPDNAGKLNSDTVLARVQSAGIPIYILGYGPKMARSGADQLERLARVSGGQTFILLNSQGVRTPLRSLASLLHHGYRIIFHSGHLADGKAHDFSVQVVYDEMVGQDTAEFMAYTANVQVSLLGLSDGQAVGGIVDLMADASAPSPIASVTYWLNGNLLGEATEPPYRVRWNATSWASDVYTLTVQAYDRVGNKGTTSVRVHVAAPISIVDLSIPTRLVLGDKLTVGARVESLEALKQVEFLLDGRSLGIGKAIGEGKYELTVSDPSFSSGDHLLAVRAYDLGGRMAERTQVLHWVAPSPPLTPTPSPRPSVLNELWVGILCIVVVVLMGLGMLAMLFKWQQAQRRGVFKLELENRGNVSDRYELYAETLGRVLQVRFMFNGRELPRREMVSHTEVVESAGAENVSKSRTEPQGKSGRSLVGRAKRLARLGDLLADVVVSVAYLLPGTLRNELLNFSRTFRRGRMTMDRVDYASSRLSGSFRSTSGGGGAPRTEQQSAKPTAGNSRGRGTPMIKPVDVVHLWSQTPVVPAGESIALQLVVTPARLYQAGLYTFQIHSRSVEQQGAPTLVHGGELFVQRVSWLFHVLSVLVVSGMVLSVTLILFWFKLV